MIQDSTENEFNTTQIPTVTAGFIHFLFQKKDDSNTVYMKRLHARHHLKEKGVVDYNHHKSQTEFELPGCIAEGGKYRICYKHNQTDILHIAYVIEGKEQLDCKHKF